MLLLVKHCLPVTPPYCIWQACRCYKHQSNQRTAGNDHLDSGDDEQVLQIVVVAEATVLQHNLLQQLNELSLQACQHEGFDSDGHLLRVA